MQGNRGQQPPRRRTRSRPDIGLSHRQQRIKEKLLEDGHSEECAICGAKGALFVNHDASGLVRGLLCGRCNRGVGLFEGSPELLQRAAAYEGCAPTPYVYGETIHLYRNKPQESTR